ncbi:9143_t:CDS:2, partial [Acaulospora colombiana]
GSTPYVPPKQKQGDPSVQEEFRSNYAFIFGFLVALGCFARITFMLYAFPLGLAFLHHVFFVARVQRRNRFDKLMGLVPACLGLMIATSICVLTDSLYFGTLKITLGDELLNIEHTFALLKNPMKLLEIGLKGELVFTPLNNLVYNSDSKNLAEHGLHPRYLHIVNFVLLFGPLVLLTMKDLIASYNCMRIMAKRKYKTATNIQLNVHDLAGRSIQSLEKLISEQVAPKRNLVELHKTKHIAFQQRLVGNVSFRQYERTLLVTPSTTDLTPLFGDDHSRPFLESGSQHNHEINKPGLMLIDQHWPHLNLDQISNSSASFLSSACLRSVKQRKMRVVVKGKLPLSLAKPDSNKYNKYIYINVQIISSPSASSRHLPKLECYSLRGVINLKQNIDHKHSKINGRDESMPPNLPVKDIESPANTTDLAGILIPSARVPVANTTLM